MQIYIHSKLNNCEHTQLFKLWFFIKTQIKAETWILNTNCSFMLSNGDELA